jgi:hypothetical protein
MQMTSKVPQTIRLIVHALFISDALMHQPYNQMAHYRKAFFAPEL